MPDGDRCSTCLLPRGGIRTAQLLGDLRALLAEVGERLGAQDVNKVSTHTCDVIRGGSDQHLPTVVGQYREGSPSVL
jgi:hypothetical protein